MTIKDQIVVVIILLYIFFYDLVENNYLIEETSISYTPLEGFHGYHVFELPDHPEEHRDESFHHTRNLTHHDDILWAQQIFGRKLYKRDFLYEDHLNTNFRTAEINAEVDVKTLYERNLQLRQKDIFEKNPNLKNVNANNVKTLYEREFNDELWALQWYELGYKIDSTKSLLDMNLVPVYKVYNVTGNGINILIIDDGVEYTHEDIRNNFKKEISFNLNQNKTDVTPRYEDPRNRHGTRCAGVVAMKANNKKCGVGIAYNSKIGGVTLLDGITNDLIEAQAIKHANDEVDIYSGSWGPQDDGQSLEGPGQLASLALYYGIKNGRNGLGSLYVFAAGNGGIFGDHCGADGYINSIYSISVASATQYGDFPYYAERCPAIIATAYSGNSDDDIKIVTTDIHNSCTLEHSGTSASAPLVAGVLALVLEANPNCTWRDVQHMIAWSCETSPLTQDVDWTKNAFGLWFTPQFGFGLINAFKIVKLAFEWKNVPEKFICSISFNLNDDNNYFTGDRDFDGSVFTNACDDSIKYLEHVQLNVTLYHNVRGHVEIELISPSDTISKLMEVRKNDRSGMGFKAWPFLTLQFWGECPVGIWRVRISDKFKISVHKGRIEHLQLILHGTKVAPQHYLENKREYEPFLR